MMRLHRLVAMLVVLAGLPAVATAGEFDEAEARFFASQPHPRRLLLLGGDTMYWRLDPGDVTQAIVTLLAATVTAGKRLAGTLKSLFLRSYL